MLLGCWNSGLPKTEHGGHDSTLMGTAWLHVPLTLHVNLNLTAAPWRWIWGSSDVFTCSLPSGLHWSAIFLSFSWLLSLLLAYGEWLIKLAYWAFSDLVLTLKIPTVVWCDEFICTHTPHFISIYIDGLPACVWRLEEGVSSLGLELEPIMNHGHVGASFLHFPAWS